MASYAQVRRALKSMDTESMKQIAKKSGASIVTLRRWKNDDGSTSPREAIVKSVASAINGAISRESEDKAEKFKRLANDRVNRAIDRIRIIGHLGNPYAYVYTEEEVEKITDALLTAVADMREKFSTESEDSDSASFKL